MSACALYVCRSLTLLYFSDILLTVPTCIRYHQVMAFIKGSHATETGASTFDIIDNLKQYSEGEIRCVCSDDLE